MAFDVKAFLAEDSEATEQPFIIEEFLSGKYDQAPKSQIVEGYFPDVPSPQNANLDDVPIVGAEVIEVDSVPTFGDQAKGVLEAAGTVTTGATTGAAGFIYGAAKGLLNRALNGGTPQEAQKMAEEYAQLLTYMPDTPEGQEYVKAIGEALDWAPPVAVAGMQMPLRAAAQGTLQAAPPIRNMPSVIQTQALPAANQAVKNAANTTINTVKNIVPSSNSSPDKSIGAAEVKLARLRQERANKLPIDPRLTKGQLTQNLDQQKQERELAKTPLGVDLRKRFNEQNQTMLGNLDAFIDDTGTKIGDFDPAATGGVISKALDNQVNAESLKIRKAYDIADKTPEAQEMVNTDPLADFLNERSSVAHQGTIYQSVQNELRREHYAQGNLNSNDLNIDDMPVWRLEKLRQFVNLNYDRKDSRDRNASLDIKAAIDSSMGNAGGEPYAKARALRHNFGNIFENRKLVSDLIDTKPNSTDRKIALENIADKAINKASKEDLVHLRQTLYRTNEGKEAYKELGAQVLKDLKDNSLRAGALDTEGNHLLSATKLTKQINRLDRL